MGMEATHYTIIGYDLTAYKTDKFDNWKWTEDGEKFCNYQLKGNFQFFDDPTSGNYLYFGFILSENNEYGDEKSAYFIEDIHQRIPDVESKLKELIETGILSDDAHYEKIQFISFVEWR